MIDKKTRTEFEKQFEQNFKGLREALSSSKEKKTLDSDFKELCQDLNLRYSVSTPSVYQFVELLECYTQFFKEKTFTEFPYSEDDPRPKSCTWNIRGYVHCTESIRVSKSKLCDKCPENPSLKKKQGPLDEVKHS